jgi:glycosyltransferase involved in cell wall biosynthesis
MTTILIRDHLASLMVSGLDHATAVSVVIPTHNRLPLLREAVAAVAAQTFDDWELIVVDDASADGTWEWLTGVDDPPLTPLRLDRNGGRSAALNRGREDANGDLLMFLDDDDLLRPEALATLVGALRDHPQAVAAVGARFRFAGRSGSRIPHPDHVLERVIWPEVLGSWSAVSGQNLYRADAARRAGPFDVGLRRAEDRDFWLRVAWLGPVVLRPEIVLDYRVHAGQERIDAAPERARAFDRFIDGLPAAEQPRARRIRDGGWRRRQADEARERGHRVRALALYAASVARAPRLAVSPLVWPSLVRSVAACLSPRRRHSPPSAA